MLLKQTKIVATISDERCDVDFLQDLFKSGMNVVRINTAHAVGEGIEKIINNVRTVSNRIALLMDTKGPEIRTTENEGGEIFQYKIGETVKVYSDPNRLSTKEAISVSYPDLVKDLSLGEEILIDDGDLDLIVAAIASGVDLFYPMMTRKLVNEAVPNRDIRTIGVFAITS